MIHDPLCAANEYGEMHDCDCEKVARVREDMLDRYAIRTSSWQQGYDAALRDTVEAIAADSEFDDVRDQWHAIDILEALGGKQ